MGLATNLEGLLTGIAVSPSTRCSRLVTRLTRDRGSVVRVSVDLGLEGSPRGARLLHGGKDLFARFVGGFRRGLDLIAAVGALDHRGE
jgi:hypothetical protein